MVVAQAAKFPVRWPRASLPKLRPGPGSGQEEVRPKKKILTRANSCEANPLLPMEGETGAEDATARNRGIPVAGAGKRGCGGGFAARDAVVLLRSGGARNHRRAAAATRALTIAASPASGMIGAERLPWMRFCNLHLGII
uniref:Uncharacterized protein n=1 Tax=Leersia perrieri TaxID=77586 RepID=A0A0D9VC60_9ORYZ